MISLYSPRERQEVEQRNKCRREADSFVWKHYDERAAQDLCNKRQLRRTSEAVISGYSCKGQKTQPGTSTTNTSHVEGRETTGPQSQDSLHVDAVTNCHGVMKTALLRKADARAQHSHTDIGQHRRVPTGTFLLFTLLPGPEPDIQQMFQKGY